MRRTLVLFATQVLLWFVLAEINHLLSASQVYVFGGALFVAYAALTQPPPAGLVATLAAGLVCDANAPVVPGTHLLLFAAAHQILFHLRDRVPRDDALSVTLVVVIANLFLFLMFSLTQFHHSPQPTILWSRLAVDLIASQVVLALVTPWFFALQARSLALARVERAEFA